MSELFLAATVRISEMKADWWRRYEKLMRRGTFRVLMKDVAEAAGVSYSQLSRWVKSEGEPSISQAIGMIALVDATLDEIFIPNARARSQAVKRVQEQQRRRRKASPRS